MPATKDDANLVMQIVRWGNEMGLTDAVVALLADEFDPEAASTDDPSVLKVLNFGEVVGTLVNQGVLDPAWFWTCGGWKGYGHGWPRPPGASESISASPACGNFEKLAGG